MAIVQTIQYFEMMDLIALGNPFAISFVKYNKTKRKGGDQLTLEGVKCSSRFIQHDILTLTHCQGGQVREVHSRLITHYNGKQVVW